VTPSALPLVSIVTPTYNMAKYLADTIESVLAQDHPNIEYIVVDGGSTDGSLEILERHRSRLRYFSEPDHGPSDAAAKGFRQARGEIFAWLNADDTYLPGAIRQGVEYLERHPETDVVYGEGWWIDESGAKIDRYPTLPFDAKVLERDCFICQPAAFIRATAYRRCELDPAVERSFDYDLWIRMAKAGMNFAAIPQYLANSRMHQGAKTIYERDSVFQASMDLLKRHYGYIPLPWKYLASLPVGLWYNRRKPIRFMGEWLLKGGRELVRRR
jgi:glycosyltransferase involved in cell wall biosynthesis